MIPALFWSFLVVFLGTAFVTLAGLIKKFEIKNTHLNILIAALLVEVAGAMVFLFRAVDWENYENPRLSELVEVLPDELKAKVLVNQKAPEDVTPSELYEIIRQLLNDSKKIVMLIELFPEEHKEKVLVNQKAPEDVTLSELYSYISQLMEDSQNLENVSSELRVAQTLVGSITNRLEILSVLIKPFGNMNPVFPPSENKRVANMFLQSILKELNIGNVQQINGDGTETRDALLALEKQTTVGTLSGLLEPSEIESLRQMIGSN